MKPPILRQLLTEDYKDAPQWMGRLFQVLNQFMEQVTQLFNQNLTFGDNIKSRSFTTSFTTSATYSTGTFETLKFSWDGSNLPQAVLLTRVVKSDTGTGLTTASAVTNWVYGERYIKVGYIPGLDNSTKYDVTFLAF
jgi:hypothetical protein